MQIPVLRPRLPAAAALLPYLQRIDDARIYSNFGPLNKELEARLAARRNLGPDAVVTVANATLGLTASLAEQNPPPGSLCLMPAWTFIASPLAALAAGLTPHFLDVAQDWALSPALAEDAIRRCSRPVGAVMPVAPFGQPLDVATWDAFRARTGIAVVIDAAAAFDAALPGEVPGVGSLHATKLLGVGEGGYVISRDAQIIHRIRAYSSFGFMGSRNAQLPGFNAKMSEYNAALGLAGLDHWETTRAELVALADAYAAALTPANGVQMQSGFGSAWIANTLVVEFADALGDAVASRLSDAGIDTRAWWGRGAHRHTATAHLTTDDLPRTERLAASTLGLPFFPGMTEREVHHVVDVTMQALRR